MGLVVLKITHCSYSLPHAPWKLLCMGLEIIFRTSSLSTLHNNDIPCAVNAAKLKHRMKHGCSHNHIIFFSIFFLMYHLTANNHLQRLTTGAKPFLAA